MSTPIRRRRATDDITGMAPPVDPVSAFKKSGKDKRDSFEGENEYANSVNRSVGETQRNVRHLKDLIDSLVLRIAELEKINEPLPSTTYVPKLIAGTDIRIDKVGRDKRISSLAAPTGGGAVNYMEVSYDSAAEEFTVQFTDLPVYVLSGNDSTPFNAPFRSNSDLTQSLVFDLPGTNKTVRFAASCEWQYGVALRIPVMLWECSGLVGSNAETLYYERTSLSQAQYVALTLNSDGTWTTYTPASIPALASSAENKYCIQVTGSTPSVSINNIFDPIMGYPENKTVSGFSLPFSGTVGLGYLYGGSQCALDVSTNSGYYDVYWPVADLVIDASGQIDRAVLYQPNARVIGWHGSKSWEDAATGNTHAVTVKNGLIANWEVVAP